jgi:His-Xaa-Ser system protein HxsD
MELLAPQQFLILRKRIDMQYFKRINDNSIEFGIDTSIFNDAVITKTFYWLSDDFSVFQETSSDKLTVTLEKQKGSISDQDFILLKTKINQDLIDFKTRDIVNQETKSIREILLVKAFANNDDFEDFNLLAQND